MADIGVNLSLIYSITHFCEVACYLEIIRAIEMVDESSIHKAEREFSSDGVKSSDLWKWWVQQTVVCMVYGIEQGNKESVNDIKLSRIRYCWFKEIIYEY